MSGKGRRQTVASLQAELARLHRENDALHRVLSIVVANRRMLFESCPDLETPTTKALETIRP